MVDSPKSKQDQSRHFGLKPKDRDSSGFFLKGSTRTVSKRPVLSPSGHISRKDLFYGFRYGRNDTGPLRNKKVQKVVNTRQVTCKLPRKTSRLDTFYNNPQTMHPEQVQMAGTTENLMGEKNVKLQEVLEEEIDVIEVDNGAFNVGANEELNGNGFFRKENGHSPQDKEKVEVCGDEKLAADANPQNGSEVKSVLRLKGSRRNSTSSRSSSVSSAPSLKQQTPMAMRMEVSIDDEERDHMEPLIMGAAAEDLEVSMSASHDDCDEGATTDSEALMDAVVEMASDPYEFEEETGSDHDSEVLLKKAKSQRSSKVIKSTKSPSKSKDEIKPVKVKTPRTKSLKLKESKPKQSDKVFDEVDTENSDTNSVCKDDTGSEDLNIKSLKSPKRLKANFLKQDFIDDGEADGKNSESDHVPRRSARSRQTPQKYNSSMYVESYWDQHMSEDRMNNSDAAVGIRSVKGRRSLRKSRNISTLNSSVHNDSSPWDNDFKVLTPSGDGVSIHTGVPLDESVDSSTPLKRKAIDDDIEEQNERGQKKMCVENADLDNSTSSQTSSFFSVITSPIIMLKNKLRGSSVSSSTPIKENCPLSQTSEPVAPAEIGNENGDNAAAPEPPLVEMEATPVVEAAPEARSWCSIM